MSLSPISSYAVTGQALPASAAPTVRTAAAVEPATVTATPTPVVTEVVATSTVTKAPTKAENAKLDQAIEAINKFLKPIASSIEFSVDEDSGRTLVKVIDTATNDVLRQFPSKEALAISHELDKFQGLLLKDKA